MLWLTPESVPYISPPIHPMATYLCDMTHHLQFVADLSQLTSESVHYIPPPIQPIPLQLIAVT